MDAPEAEVLEQMPLVGSGAHLFDARNQGLVSLLDREIYHLSASLSQSPEAWSTLTW